MASALLSANAFVGKTARVSFRGQRVSAPSNGIKCRMAKAGNWLPGSDSPAWLDGSLPADYGFDPLKLGEEPASLARFRESEVYHCRWAMLGVVGALAVEILGYGNWHDAVNWALTPGGKPTWFGIEVPFDLNTLVAVEFFAFAGAEGLRGSAEPEKRVYPGGAFNPLGFGKDEADMEQLKLKEIKNGRLAMLAFIGFISAHAATGKGPLEALSAHLANPAGVNFATNGVSLPFLQ